MVINGGFLRNIDFTLEPQGREKHTGLLMIL